MMTFARLTIYYLDKFDLDKRPTTAISGISGPIQGTQLYKDGNRTVILIDYRLIKLILIQRPFYIMFQTV